MTLDIYVMETSTLLKITRFLLVLSLTKIPLSISICLFHEKRLNKGPTQLNCCSDLKVKTEDNVLDITILERNNAQITGETLLTQSLA